MEVQILKVEGISQIFETEVLLDNSRLEVSELGFTVPYHGELSITIKTNSSYCGVSLPTHLLNSHPRHIPLYSPPIAISSLSEPTSVPRLTLNFAIESAAETMVSDEEESNTMLPQDTTTRLENERLDLENVKLNDRISELEACLEAERTRSRNLEVVIEDLKHQQTRASQDLLTQKSNYENLQQYVRIVLEEYGSALKVSENKELKKKYLEVKSLKEHLADTYSELREAKINQENTKHALEVGQSTNVYVRAKCQLTNTSEPDYAELQCLRENLGEFLSQNYLPMQREKGQKKLYAQRLEYEVMQYKNEIKNLREKALGSEEENHKAQKELKSELSSKNTQIAQLKEEMYQVQIQLQELKTDSQEKSQTIESLEQLVKKINSETDSRNKEVIQDINNYQSQISELQGKLNQIKKEHSSLTTILQHKDKQLADNQTYIAELYSQLEDYENGKLEIERKEVLPLKLEIENLKTERAEAFQRLYEELSSKESQNIDKMLEAYFKALGVENHFQKITNGKYAYGNRKVAIDIKNGGLVIRVGGGYMYIDEFLKTYSEDGKSPEKGRFSASPGKRSLKSTLKKSNNISLDEENLECSYSPARSPLSKLNK